MLNDFTGADKVYIACGYTDLRKGIDGLASLVQQSRSVYQYPVPVLRKKQRSNKRSVLRRRRVRTCVQATGAGNLSMAEDSTGSYVNYPAAVPLAHGRTENRAAQSP